MSIIPVRRLSAGDLLELGNNLPASVMRDQAELRAVNRSLALHDELVQRLYRPRAATARRSVKRPLVH
jgi:hypothetical protein